MNESISRFVDVQIDVIRHVEKMLLEAVDDFQLYYYEDLLWEMLDMLHSYLVVELCISRGKAIEITNMRRFGYVNAQFAGNDL